MASVLIKMCGIKSPEMGVYAVQQGASYIGVVFCEKSPRHVDVKTAALIAEAVKKLGAVPVAVFADADADEIVEVCAATGIDCVQLHGDKPRAALHDLPERLQVIYAVTPLHGSIPALRADQDFILFDGINPGSGEPMDWSKIQAPKGMRVFLAGGLNPGNVAEAISIVHPFAVDVSSGVESEPGVKSEKLITEFVVGAKNSPSSRYYGNFGGQFLPELLIAPIQQLEHAFDQIKNDPAFKKELNDILENYAGRATPLTEVKRFAAAINGPRIFLKREDLLHTGAHKFNNAIGQCLLAKQMGKHRIIAETGAGQHGVATATACALLGLDCVIYMGAVDMARQMPNVSRMRLLGATVVSVEHGAQTLKDAVNEALRDWAENFQDSHYCLGSALGPYPYPQMVAYFQEVIGLETKAQCEARFGKNPDCIVACVGGGSNAIGIFAPFISDASVTLIGIEAGGTGNKTGEHAARFLSGTPGVLHGCHSYLLQDNDGQVAETHSISAGLDYPMIGPAHADLFEKHRVTYASVQDAAVIEAFKLLSRTEGIIPALESSHALAYVAAHASSWDKSWNVVINLSGRGDKDLPQLFEKNLLGV